MPKNSKTVDINYIDIAMTLIDEIFFQGKDEDAKQNSTEADKDEEEGMYDEWADNENDKKANNRSQRYASRQGNLVQLDQQTPKKLPGVEPASD